MQKPIIVANWKSHKTEHETKIWFDSMQDAMGENEKIVIVCPSFTSLSYAASQSLVPKIFLGAQDISPFPEGAYTGEVYGRQIKEFAEYVIIGHSERRKHFQEDDVLLEKKVAMAIQHGLTPIFCVPDAQTYIPDSVTIVAYEPIWAIGTGKAESPEQANTIAKTIKEKASVLHVLYGGSVTSENVSLYTKGEYIDGILIGSASLDPHEFSQIVAHA